MANWNVFTARTLHLLVRLQFYHTDAI